MDLNPAKSVLEIGVGTGRLALRTAPLCRDFTGIDLSSETLKRAWRNMEHLDRVCLICGDFLNYPFSRTFDVIYSSLTLMHIQDKASAIRKAASLLKKNGRFLLSIDKNRSEWLDYGSVHIRVYPDEPRRIEAYLISTGLELEEEYDTALAWIFSVRKENLEYAFDFKDFSGIGDRHFQRH